jgi:hypothetical protein
LVPVTLLAAGLHMIASELFVLCLARQVTSE